MNKIKVSPSMLTGVAVRMAFLLELRKYYKSKKWKDRRDAYLLKVGGLSEVSNHPAKVVHHLTYQFKSVTNFKNADKLGAEKDGQLLALTYEEHDITHTILQHVAHKPRKLLNELKNYFGY